VTTFFLVRHAVTSHTGHKLTGRLKGVHLTDEGKRQAEDVAGRLKNVKFDAIYSSPIDRTMETARAIASAQGQRVKVRQGLNELDFGTWTDKTFKVLVKNKLWPTIQRWPSGARFPRGESFLEAQQRGVAEIERLRAAHPKQTICCVSHADLIKLVVAHYLGMHLDLFQRLDVGPASVSVIAIGNSGPRVVTVNSFASIPARKQ
jgi:probable phosphomutase (TIGR03848 family)